MPCESHLLDVCARLGVVVRRRYKACRLFLVAALLPASSVPVGAAVNIAKPERDCPVFIPIPRALHIESRYVGGASDPNNSRISNTKSKDQQVYRSSIEVPAATILATADRFRSAKSSRESSAALFCLRGQFVALAGNDSMYDIRSSEDAFYRDWMIATLGIAYLKAKADLDRDPSSGAIKRWFSDNISSIKKKQLVRQNSNRVNNHFYWGGLALAAAGHVVDDTDAKAASIVALKIGMRSINDKGFLPTELERGDRALHYHVFAAAPLAGIAILDGLNVEDVQPGAMSRLVENVALSLEEFPGGPISKASGFKQKAIEGRGNLFLLWAVVPESSVAKARLHGQIANDRPYARLLGGKLDFMIEKANRQ